MCGDPFDAFSDDDYCGQCSARRVASFEIRKLSITARILVERTQAKQHRDNKSANKPTKLSGPAGSKPAGSKPDRKP